MNLIVFILRRNHKKWWGFSRFLLNRLLLLTHIIWVLFQNLFFGDFKLFKKQICRRLADDIRFFSCKQFSGFELKVLMVLPLGFFDVIIKWGLLDFFLLPLLFFCRQTIELYAGVSFLVNCFIKVGFKSTNHVRKLPLHAWIPMIFNSVVGAAIKHLCNFSPFVINQSVH